MANSAVALVVALIYALPSLLVYCSTVVIIIVYWKNVKSSFYQFYIFEFFMNVLTFWNTVVALRLPSSTCFDCRMASFFLDPHRSQSSLFNQFQYAMKFHMAYVQYSTTAIVALNRATIIYRQQTFEPFWRKFSWLFMIFIACAPFGFTYPVFLNDAKYKYHPASDYYSLDSDYKSWIMFECLLPTMIVTTVITIIANIVSFIRLAKLPYTPRQLEKSFLTVTILASLAQVLGTILSAMMLFSSPGSGLSVFTTQALPFVSDTLTLIQPYLLLVFCHGIRKRLASLALLCNCFIPDLNRVVHPSYT